MKKIFAILGLCFVFTITSCSFTEEKALKGIGIPSHVSYIAFNNGGTTIIEAEILKFSFNQTKQWFLFREMQIVFSSMFTS